MRERIKQIVEYYARKNGYEKMSIRAFCLENDINPKSLDNSMRAERMDMGMIERLKGAVPELNINWLLFSEGHLVFSQDFTNKNIK